MADTSSVVAATMGGFSRNAAEPATLDDFVHVMLAEHGFDDLPKEEQQRLLPGFTEQALVRLGVALAPKLTPEGLDEFLVLSDSNEATPDDWARFWHVYVPDFASVARETLEQYIAEIEVLLHA